MESLAVFVGFLLLTLLISMILTSYFSFIRNPFARLTALISGSYGVVLGSILMINSAGSTNLFFVGLIPTIVGVSGIVVSSIRSRKNKAS